MIATHRLAATLCPATAAATAWQAVIVGAGPAGSSAAITLARAGWRVLLLERSDMPRPKVCGCCLSPRAHAALRALVAVPAGASLVGEIPLEHVRVLAAGRSIRVPLPAGGVISREALDTALVQEAITAGAAWLPGVEVTAVCESPEASPPLRVGGTTRRIFRVGDAAGYVEPFTGEGMGWALSSSRILTAALLGSPDPAGDYERLHAAGFRSLHRRCRRVAAALRHPGLVRSAMRVAAVAPWAARRFVPLVVGATSGSGATS